MTSSRGRVKRLALFLNFFRCPKPRRLSYRRFSTHGGKMNNECSKSHHLCPERRHRSRLWGRAAAHRASGASASRAELPWPSPSHATGARRGSSFLRLPNRHRGHAAEQRGPAARRPPPTFLRRVTSAGLRATEHVASVWCGGDRPRRAGAAAAAGTDTAGPGAPSAGRSGVSLAASFAVTPRRSSEDPLPLSRAPTLSPGSRRGLLPSAAPATRLPRRGQWPVVGSRATLETCRCEMRLRPEAAPPGRRSRPARERPAEFPSGPPGSGSQPSQPSHPLAPPAPPPSPRSWPVFPTRRSPPPEPAAPPAPRAPPDSPSGTRHPLLVPPGAQTPGAATDSFEQRTHLSRPQLPRKYKLTMAPATRGGKEKRKRVSAAAQ